AERDMCGKGAGARRSRRAPAPGRRDGNRGHRQPFRLGVGTAAGGPPAAGFAGRLTLFAVSPVVDGTVGLRPGIATVLMSVLSGGGVSSICSPLVHTLSHTHSVA